MVQLWIPRPYLFLSDRSKRRQSIESGRIGQGFSSFNIPFGDAEYHEMTPGISGSFPVYNFDHIIFTVFATDFLPSLSLIS